MTDLLYQSARALLAGLEQRRFSARELLDAHWQRHDELRHTLNAVVATDLDRAREEAKRIDEARAGSRPVGPLAGLPMTVKDGFDVEGMPSVCGVPALADRSKDCPDADMVAAVRQAGAVVWGKSNVPTMLSDFQTFNPAYGTTNNPYDTSRTPGGSSGGAATALAAGITPLEIGSDIGGSLRHPANFCGVYALKPTWDTLSMRGQVPPGPGTYVNMDLGVVGPMARSVDDLKLLFDVLRGQSPSRVREASPGRVAIWLDDPELVVADEVRKAVLGAAEALRGQGYVVEAVAPPLPTARLMDSYLRLLFAILMASVPDGVYAGLLAGRERALAEVARGADRYGPDAFVVNATASYRDVWQATVLREELKIQLAAWFDGWDAILAPISPVPAFPHNQEGSIATRTLDMDGRTVPYQRMLDWVALATATHAPALAAPVGSTDGGLPIGVQLVGRCGEDDRLFSVAAALERATGGFRPPTLPG